MKSKGWLLALLVALPALIPLLRPGWYEGHDDLHIYRLVEYDAALRDGQIPPRWFPDIHGGRGNPHPIYYAPLFYYVAWIFKTIGLGTIGGLKAALVLATLGASAALYRYARLFLDGPASLVAAATYTYIPYHLLDLYVRQALSEYTVFALLPVLLLAFHQIRVRGGRSDLILGALAVAGMSTAHTISTMLVPPILAAYALVLSLPALSARRAFEWRWIPKAGLAAGIGYALAGFFLVPAFLERGAINLASYTDGYFDFHKHFVHPSQLLWSRWGFGMSLEGLKDGISYRLGLVAIAGTLLAPFAISRFAPRATGRRLHALFFLGMALLAILMTTALSTAIWEALPPLRFLQFPWRFLTLSTLAMGLLTGVAWQGFATPRAPESARAWRGALALSLLLPVAAAAGGLFGVNLRVPPGRVAFEEKPYINMVLAPESGAPVTLDTAYVRRHSLHWIDHLPPGVSYMEATLAEAEGARASVVSGQAVITDLREATAALSFHVEAATPARVRVNLYSFPGWSARVDGAPVPLVPSAKRPRLIQIDLPAGSHAVDLGFDSTPARRLGDGLTLAGLAGLALAGLLPERR